MLLPGCYRDLAGLLAWVIAGHLPIPCGGTVVEGLQGADEKPGFTSAHPYSYGDSAGIAPDFPFNPGMLVPGTKSGRR